MTATMFVGGRWRSGLDHVTVTDPARPSDVVGEYDCADAADVDESCLAAAAALEDWSRRAPAARVEMLDLVGRILEERTETVARLVVLEEGKTIGEATAEVRRAAAIFRYYAGEVLQPSGSVLPNAGTLTFTRRLPRGVVGVITAFNYPLLVPAWKIAAALAFGNTVVWKPARGATLPAIELVRVMVEAGLPDGVVNLVPGRGPTLGPLICRHPRLAALTFTGSTQVGRSLERLAAGRGVAMQLEMGGKNGAIVLDDADLPRAAERLAYGVASGTGQKCTAIERVIVDQAVADDLVELLAEKLRAWKVGHGLDPATRMGPLVDAAARRRVLEAVAQATDAGAVVVVGGPSELALRTGGHFVDPYLLDRVDVGAAIAREEVFGPVASVLRVAGEEEAVAAHEATHYGLNAGVFTRDLDRALRIVDRLEVGMVHVNDISGFPHHAPFGGRKDSGYGPLELGKSAAAFFTEEQVVHIHRASGR